MPTAAAGGELKMEHYDVTDTLSFEDRCDVLMKRIDAGRGVPTQLEISRTLELPLSYVEAAVAISVIEFIRHNSWRRH